MVKGGTQDVTSYRSRTEGMKLYCVVVGKGVHLQNCGACSELFGHPPQFSW